MLALTALDKLSSPVITCLGDRAGSSSSPLSMKTIFWATGKMFQCSVLIIARHIVKRGIKKLFSFVVNETNLFHLSNLKWKYYSPKMSTNLMYNVRPVRSLTFQSGEYSGCQDSYLVNIHHQGSRLQQGAIPQRGHFAWPDMILVSSAQTNTTFTLHPPCNIYASWHWMTFHLFLISTLSLE